MKAPRFFEGSLGNIDAKICKTHDNTNDESHSSKDAGKCYGQKGNTAGLKAWFGASNNNNWSGGAKGHEKWHEHNANVVAKDTTSNLTREEKGVVSSVFAKVIEGAEILQSILSNIDAKICKAYPSSQKAESDSLGTSEAGKCIGATLTNGRKGLSKWFVQDNTDWKDKGHEKWMRTIPRWYPMTQQR